MATGTLDPADLIVLTPSSKPVAELAQQAGARINPPPQDFAEARAVVLAVKPAVWRQAVTAVIPTLAADATIVSVMAGVRSEALTKVFVRPVARVMPTTAVANGQGVAALWSANKKAADVARALFAPLADVVELPDEDAMDIATAVSGSGPAYVYAFTRALAEAGVAAGLNGEAAIRLARGAIRSAAAADPSTSLDDLIARIASPGGTTQAGLAALATDDALDRSVDAAVRAALARARELGT